jgi:hypothetical protein
MVVEAIVCHVVQHVQAKCSQWTHNSDAAILNVGSMIFAKLPRCSEFHRMSSSYTYWGFQAHAKTVLFLHSSAQSFLCLDCFLGTSHF